MPPFAWQFSLAITDRQHPATECNLPGITRTPCFWLPRRLGSLALRRRHSLKKRIAGPLAAFDRDTHHERLYFLFSATSAQAPTESYLRSSARHCNRELECILLFP